ncbi:cation/H(+) antiporter 3 [Ziziphus jujuba]|uniref:Cation/H(+) antiporter 3 n=1 Tax=Ziziphus jujuba TaxID=326968 RepID=A0ABM3IEU0_ZIZJJ|nr:cation/H(+) antiporter 3 [Ziziphus jujuba]
MDELMYNERQKPELVDFDVCTELPPKVNSECDIFHRLGDRNDEWIMTSSMPELEVTMAMMFFMSHIVHFFLKYIGFPRIANQIISGIILTFILVDYSNGKTRVDNLFTRTGQEVLGTIYCFGYQLFLFMTAVKMDMGTIVRAGKKAIIIGVAAPLLPFFFGLRFTTTLQKQLTETESNRLKVMALGQSLICFPVISSIITELNILNTEFGRLALSASMVGDVVSISLGIFVNLGIAYLQGGAKRTAIDLLSFSLYVMVVVFVIRPLMFRMIKSTPEGRPVKNVYVYTIVLLALISSLLSNMFGQFILLGPYILGMAVPEGPPLGSTVVDKLDCFVSGVFLPLMVTTTGMRVDFKKIKYNAMMKSTIVIAIVTYIVKFVACLLPCLYFRMPSMDSFALALIMTSEGIVELALYSSLRDDNGLDDQSYAVMLLIILALSILVPIVVKYLYDPSRKYAGYQKRNIMHLKPNSELRVLACINRPDNVPAMINLLDYSCPTKENPITVYVLHLIELIGRASPIFISHQIQKKTISNVSYSENVILSFSRFERDNWGTVNVNAFTAISPPKLMYDDICTMALNRLTSLIILPFHRKWSIDGSVEVDDNMVRTLNSSVLERAPCSVGILVSRGNSQRRGNANALPNSDVYVHSVCTIFMGGKDDREALVFAKRMAKDPSISLTVIQFIPPKELPENPNLKWEKMLDAEVLKDVRYSNSSVAGEAGFVGYTEEVVKDGSETALIVRSLVDDYDLIITGRRYGVESPQTSGLMEWSEFPELGAIGDLLVSTDVYGRASVLVVQQQVID